MNQTSFKTFQELATEGTFVPVYKEVLADLLTPLSAFLAVAEHAEQAGDKKCPHERTGEDIHGKAPRDAYQGALSIPSGNHDNHDNRVGENGCRR